MKAVSSLFYRHSTISWWLFGFGLFWGATFAAAAVDYAGDRWLGIAWPTGPDLFPNMALGYPLAFIQLVAAFALLISGVRLASSPWSLARSALGLMVVAVTSALCFLTFALFALWYSIDFMRRSL